MHMRRRWGLFSFMISPYRRDLPVLRSLHKRLVIILIAKDSSQIDTITIYQSPKYYQRRFDDHDAPALLNRLSNSPSSSHTATLLDRIGCQVEGGETNSGGEYMPSFRSPPTSPEPREVEFRADKPVAVGPGEVERFLESVLKPHVVEAVGRPGPAAQEARVSEDVPPALAKRIGQRRLSRSPLPRSMIQSMEQERFHTPNVDGNVANDNLPNHHNGEHIVSPSTTTVLEQCRTHLAPVVLASVTARDSQVATQLQQCATILSDDRCASLLRHAKDMREQLRSSAHAHVPSTPRCRSPEYLNHESDYERTNGRVSWNP
ncbi:hypothetical protein BKA82DRAFT_2962558 [Pisolithus tinctorius]|nr:hypothetical protein BKA82DRAFT_2962558 [Pisolithus tinctorius]